MLPAKEIFQFGKQSWYQGDQHLSGGVASSALGSRGGYGGIVSDIESTHSQVVIIGDKMNLTWSLTFVVYFCDPCCIQLCWCCLDSRGKISCFQLVSAGSTNGVALRLAGVVVGKCWFPGMKSEKETPSGRLGATGNEWAITRAVSYELQLKGSRKAKGSPRTRGMRVLPGWQLNVCRWGVSKVLRFEDQGSVKAAQILIDGLGLTICGDSREKRALTSDTLKYQTAREFSCSHPTLALKV
jgi:hypothetical protein